MKKRNIKKASIIIASVLLVAMSITLLAACNKAKVTPPAGKPTATQLYGFTAASAGAILQSFNAGNSNAAAAAEGQTEPAEQPADPAQDQINAVKDYMSMVENFLGDNPLSVTEAASDNAEYTNMLVVKNSDLSGNKYEYILYYNESDVTVEEEEDGVEIESRIEGIMILNGVNYTVDGQKEIEGDEFEIAFTAKIDENNYVKIKQEIEADEQKFVYEVFENGKKVSKFEIEIEDETDETEVEMKVETADGTEIFKFKKEVENNKTVIKIVIQKGNERTELKVHIETKEDGTEVYKFMQGNTVVGEQNKPDYDDED